MRRIVLIIGVLLFVTLLAPLGVYADYECGTYGAGDFGATNYQNTDCSTATTGTSTPAPIDLIATTPDTETTAVDVSQQDSILLNDYQEYVDGQVKTLTVSVGQVIHFILNNEQHTITIKSITDQEVGITIASTPHDVTIQKGQTVKDDVNGDGTKDIAISYFSSGVGVATMGFRQLPVENTQAADNAAPVAAKANYMWIIWVGAGVVVLAIIIGIIAWRVHKRAV